MKEKFDAYAVGRQKIILMKQKFDYLKGYNSFGVAAMLVGHTGSIGQAEEVAKELHYHRNCWHSLYLEELFFVLYIIEKEKFSDLKEISEEFRGEERKKLEKRLEGIPKPFKFKFGVYV